MALSSLNESEILSVTHLFQKEQRDDSSRCSWLYCRINDLFKQYFVFAITFFFQILFGYKTQGSGIDAITHSTRFGRAVVEQVTQMGIAFTTSHFSTNHEVAKIGFFLNIIVTKWTGEARPAAAGIVFVGGTEQWLTGHDIHIDSVTVVIPELVMERWFGCVVLGNFVLQRRQTLFQALYPLCRTSYVR